MQFEINTDTMYSADLCVIAVHPSLILLLLVMFTVCCLAERFCCYRLPSSSDQVLVRGLAVVIGWSCQPPKVWWSLTLVLHIFIMP